MKTLDKQGIAVGNFRTAEESSSFLMMLSELHSNQPRKKLLSIGIKEFAIQLAHPFAYNEKQSVERMVRQIDDKSKQLSETTTSIPNFFQQLRKEGFKLAKENTQGGRQQQGFGPELKPKEAEELAEAFMTEVHKPLLVSEVKSATKSYSGMSFQLYIYGLETSIRAIPAKPIKLKFLSFEGRYIQANLKDSLRETELGKVMGSKITFFDANLYVDELRTSVGINLQDHYKTILSYIKKVTKLTSSSIRSTYMENFVDKTLPTDPKASPTAANPQINKGLKWWDKNRLIIYGNAQVKFKKLAMDVLTSTSSKMEECLRLSMDTLYLKYNEKLEVYVADILLSRLVDSTNQKNSGEAVEIKEGQTSILKIPQVEATFKYNWVTVTGTTETSKTANENLFMLLLQKKSINENDLAATKLKVQLSVNIPSKSGYHEHPLVIQNENLQKTIELSPVPVFHYQSELFSSLIELPQLSNEYLRSKGIRIMNLDAFSNQTKEKPQAASQPTPKSDKPTPEAPGTPLITLQREDSKRPGDLSPRGKPRTPRLKEQITDEGTLKNLLESVKIGPEFASYINLISVTLDEQLNMATQKNLLSILDDVEFRINTSHLRILMTNLEKTQHLKVKTHKDDPNLYSLRGIQAVMRSLNFTTVLFKSQTNIRKEVFRRLFHSEGEKLLQWAAKNGRGRIQTMYASFFDSTHLLSLLPKNLEKIRKDRFEESLESPEAFRKFFGLDFVPIKAFHHAASSASPKQASSPDLNHINHLFNIKTAQEFFPFFMKKSFELRQQREEEKKRNRESSNSKLGFDRPLALMPTLSGNSEAVSEHLDSKELPAHSLFAGLLKKNSTKDAGRTKGKPGKELSSSNTTANFEFSPVGGFFKAYDLRYDQNFRPDQEIATIDSQDNYRYVANTFNHFINVSSCKLLVGENLSKIGSLLILEPLGALQKKIKGGGASKLVTSRTRTLGAAAAPKYSASGTLNDDAKKEFVPSADQTKPPVTAVYSFGVKIQTPQINFFREDQGSQIIFTSHTGMLFFNMQHFLPYDFNQSDPKQLFYLNCHQMGIHSAPPSIDFHQKIFWIEDNQYSSYQVQPSINAYQSVRSPDHRRNGDLHSVSEPNLTHDSSFSKPNNWFVHSQPIKVNREGEWKTGVLNKLVTAEKMTVFELIKYKNPKANYDYSKKQAPALSEPTTYWNGDPRYLSIRFIFDSFQSKLNGQDFDLLLELPKMFVNMVAKQDVKPDANLYSKPTNFAGKDKRENRGASTDAPPTVPTQEVEATPKVQDKDISPEMRQLRHYGQAAIAEHLKKHLTHRSQLSKDAYTSQSHIQFIFKDIMLTMTSLDSVPHLKMELKYLTFKARIVGSAYNSYQVGIQNIQISPCPEMRQRDQAMMPPDEQLKPDEMILKPIHKPSDKFLGSAGCNQVFYLEQNIYNIEGFKPDAESDTPSKAVWKAVNNLEIRADPFVINLNHEIIKFLQEYMFIRELNKIYKHLEKKENIEPRLYLERNDEYFRKKEQAIRIAKAEIKAEQDREKVKIADEEANILPTYYNLVKFNQMKLVITNKTTNILQQLEKMRLTVDTFEIREQFLTRRALLDRVLKYMLSAAFTRVLKYKVSCFSGGQSDEDEQGAAEKEEDRKLQILMG